MSFVELPLGDTQEPEVVPEAVYNLRVEDVIEKNNPETKRLTYLCLINVEDPPEDIANPGMIFHNLNMPNKDDDKKASDFMMLELKRFLVAFDVPFEGNGFNSEDIPGSTAEMLVIEGEYDGRPKNELRLPAIEE